MPIPFLSALWLRLCRWPALCLLLTLVLSQAQAAARIDLLASNAAPAALSDIVTTPRVQAQLVVLAPEGIAPGESVQFGLRLNHQPGWHTYWKNAGDSGLPTELQWRLPAGLQPGAIDWPLPQQIRVGDLLNYGYEGQVLLPVPVQVSPEFQPGPDGLVNLQLSASWLVCRVECIPEQGEFQLQLPAAASQALWAEEFAAAQARRPSPLPEVQAQAQPTGDRIALRVRGLPAAAQGRVLDFYPEAADTFQHAAVLGQDWTQSWEGDTWTADLPLSGMRGNTPAQLAWVLAPAGSPEPAWRVQAQVNGSWAPVPRAEVSAALSAALAANQQAALPSPAAGSAFSGSLWAALIGGLLGGLLLNLMPCVFPVLAIKVLGFARQGADRRAQRAAGLAYSVGVIASFLALGGLLLGLRAAGEQLGWGFQLQSPAVVAALAALFTLLALNLSGLFEFGSLLPSRLANLHSRHPLAEAGLSGVLAVAIASPCTAPFMGASLGFAVGMPAVQALAVFAALGLGMALPYALASWLPGLVRWLPRPGAWMETFRHAMAFPMLATVIWLVWVIGQQSGIDGAAALLALLLCLTALIWSLGLTGRTRIGLSLAVLVLSAWLAPNLTSALLTPLPASASAEPNQRWQAWSPEAQQALLDQGRPVFVDYTAAWCVTCQFNKRQTLSQPALLADFDQRQVALLRADWTRRDPAITSALAALGRSGVPVYVLLAPGRPPQVLSELLSVTEVQQALARL